jgi:hypothetical protein
MADDEHIAAFFAHLASRCGDEPHLTDVTYAMLRAVPELRKDFVRFFDPKLPVEQEIEVVRDYALPDGSGPFDLQFRTPSWSLMVENRLDDTNYRFERYARADAKLRLGLIGTHIHPSPANSRWLLRSWAEFVEQLEQNVYAKTSALVSGYLSYVREVCGMKELAAFALEPAALNALRRFNEVIADVLAKTKIDGGAIRPRSDAGTVGRTSAGSHFTVMASSGASMAAFFGVDYRADPLFIGVAVEEQDASYTKVVMHVRTSPAFTVELDKLNGARVWLKMPRPQCEKLNSSADVREQRRLLDGFFSACCTALVRALAP